VELELPKPDSPVWQTVHSGFVSELGTQPIQNTSRHFIYKSMHGSGALLKFSLHICSEIFVAAAVVTTAKLPPSWETSGRGLSRRALFHGSSPLSSSSSTGSPKHRKRGESAAVSMAMALIPLVPPTQAPVQLIVDACLGDSPLMSPRGGWIGDSEI
jgi:hypothetical protein